MENISFVLWVCLWPLSCSIGSYFYYKKLKMTGEKPISSDGQLAIAIIELAMWVVIGQGL